MTYKNFEGYSDPTAGQAMSKVMREYRARQKETWNRRYEIRNRPRVYVASRYAGDVERNVAAAVRCCQFAIRRGCMPIASHLLYPQILQDNIPEERELGTVFGLALLALCDEVWFFTDGDGLSPGMAAEEHEAKRLGKPIRYFDLEVTL